MRLGKDRLTTKLKVTFGRSHKIYIKNIYFILTNTMKENLKDSNNLQFFMDCTYYAIPVNNNNFKLLIILVFNIIQHKSKLCLIVLNKNENIETFSIILDYLNKNFNFYPKIFTTDCSIAEIKAIKKVFPLCKNLLCYYHIIQRCVKHLPQIRSKNTNIKQKAKDLLNNIKILLFIDTNNIEKYYNKIINAYKNDFYKFIKYFYINYFNRFPFSERIWNYSIINMMLIDNPNIIFYTNNLVKSTNRTLNNKYRGICKTFCNFEYAIYELIDYFEKKMVYKEKQINMTKALSIYTRQNKYDNLTTNKKFNNYLKELEEEYNKNNKCNEAIEDDLYESI